MASQKDTEANIDAWLSAKKSPMAGYADYMAILARHFGVPISLCVAVAQAETQCATDPNMEPLDLVGHNAWGYGHPPGATHGFAFSSWPDSINAVTERLSQIIHDGCDTVSKLSGVWVRGDINSPVEVWSNNVSSIMSKFGGNPVALVKTPLTPAP